MVDRLTSVWEGNDKDLLAKIIPFYLRRKPNLVFDVTWGSGKWWEDVPWPVVGMDKYVNAPICGDYTHLPLLSASVDVLIFDPPHRSAGGPNRSRLMEDRFGSVGYRPEDLLPTLPIFFREAYRVLAKGGIVLVKMTNQVHWHRQIWHDVECIIEGRNAGLTACDQIIKVRAHGIVSSKWKNSYHALKRHCCWLVFRKGRCEPR